MNFSTCNEIANNKLEFMYVIDLFLIYKQNKDILPWYIYMIYLFYFNHNQCIDNCRK